MVWAKNPTFDHGKKWQKMAKLRVHSGTAVRKYVKRNKPVMSDIVTPWAARCQTCQANGVSMTVNTRKWCEKSWEPGNYEETIIHKASWKHWTLFSRGYYTNNQINFGGLVLNAYDEFGQTMVNEVSSPSKFSIDHILNVGFIYHKIQTTTDHWDTRSSPKKYWSTRKNVATQNSLVPWWPKIAWIYGCFPKIWSHMVLSFDHPGILLWAIEAIDTSTGGSTPFVLNKIFELAFLSA